MAKLRKMLGYADAPATVALMRLMETQSSVTLANWVLSVVEQKILPIYQKTYPTDTVVPQLIDTAKGYMQGNVELGKVKAQIRTVKRIARDMDDTLVAQVSARAIATACTVTYLPTGALSYTFYAVAALVYDELGLQENPVVYEEQAAEKFKDLVASLQAVAVADEPNPVQVNWNC